MANVFSSLPSVTPGALQGIQNAQKLGTLPSSPSNNALSNAKLGSSSIAQPTTQPVAQPAQTSPISSYLGSNSNQTFGGNQPVPVNGPIPNNSTPINIDYTGSGANNPQINNPANGSSFNNYTGALAGSATQNNATLGSSAQDIANKAGAAISAVGQQGDKSAAGYLTTGTSPVGEGNAAVLKQTTAAQQQAIAQGANMQLQGNAQALTAQNQAQSGLNQAAGLVAPQAGAAFFGSPTTGGTVGQGNSLISNGVSQAAKLIASGATTADAIAQAGLSNLGPGAMQALTQEMQKYDPNWTPTSSNAIAAQNMSQGQKYQGEATQLNTTLSQLDQLAPTITKFMTDSGINNSDVPFYNENTKSYVGALQNPANLASFNAMMADVKTYMAQILGSSGLNPTEVSATVNSFDPKSLNPNQLTSLLSNLKNLGQTRLQPLQQSASASYGNSNGYMGSAATPSVQSSVASNSTSANGSHITNPILQQLTGAGLRLTGGIEGVVSGLASKVFGL